MQTIALRIFPPTLYYILLLTQTTAFYIKNTTNHSFLADHSKNITNYSSQTVANVIETGSAESTALLVQRQKNNEQLAQLKIQQSGGEDVQSQIDDLTQANTQIDQQLKTNANQGSITINAANEVNILASQNITNNHSAYNETNMMYSIQDNHDLQIATTVSPLLSSNNITISADNNINLLSSILVGQGNLNLTSTNGNVNMQSLQDLYYQYDFSQATSMNLGALLGMLLAAVVIGAVTGGAGALALGAIGAATVSVGTAVVVAAIASAVGVALQLGITAAIDAKNGGAAATAAMQSGHMDSTTKQYSSNVGSSLLFGGNVNTSSGNTSIDTATSIQSANTNQIAQTNESASFKEEHKTIGPDWNQLMMDAAINGVVAGTTVVAGDFLTWYTSFKPTWAMGDDFATWKPTNELAATDEFKAAFPDYKGVIDPKVNNIGMANEAKITELSKVGKPVSPTEVSSWMHEGSWFSSGVNKIPGMNSMSLFHDTWATTWNMNPLWTIATIAPSVPIEYSALGGHIFSGIGTGVDNGANNK